MRIGIDARTILNPKIGEAAGIGHYTYQLMRHLLIADKNLESGKNEYVFFFDNCLRKKDAKKFQKKNVKIRHFPFSTYRKFLPGIYSETLIGATLSREKLDILHSAGCEIPIIYRGKLIVTARDIAFYKIPELFPRMQRAKARIAARSLFKKADLIITTSKNSKKDLADLFKIEPEKISVIYNGIDERFFEKAPQEEIKKVKNKYKIRGKYLLFLSTIKPLNNLTRLITAFSQIKNKLNKSSNKNPKEKYSLVLAGKDGWLAKEIHQIAKNLGIKKDVIFTGYVPPEDLNSLFGGAELFVFPPVYEEFGAPILEAMADGTPVIASNVSSIPEIANGAAKLIDPYDVKGIGKAILNLISNKPEQEKLIKKGLVQAKKFTWQKCAEETLNVYGKVGGK
jgi:glycosyltransferase involved in cell wall biosynthesis